MRKSGPAAAGNPPCDIFNFKFIAIQIFVRRTGEVKFFPCANTVKYIYFYSLVAAYMRVNYCYYPALKQLERFF